MRIFISYRRQDSAGHVHSIYRDLKQRFGDSATILLDVASMEAGSKWFEETKVMVATCDVCLAVIGQRWLTERLKAEDDVVRFELETALTHGSSVVPVLVDGASLPIASQLPPPLRGLVDWQAVWLNHQRIEDYEQDLARLADRIRAIMHQREIAQQQKRAESEGYGVVRIRPEVHGPVMYSNLYSAIVLINEREVGIVKPNEKPVRDFRVPAGFCVVRLDAHVSLLGRLPPQSRLNRNFERKHEGLATLFKMEEGEIKDLVCSFDFELGQLSIRAN